MTRPLLLVGSGGLARETAEAVRACADRRLVGFADDDPTTWGTWVDGLPVLGGPEVLTAHDEWDVLLCTGSGAARAALAARLHARGVGDDRYATVVHPDASVPGSCSLGPGSVVLAGTVLTTAVSVGRSVVLMPGCVLTHDDVLADFVTLCARVALAGGVRVGARAYLGTGATVREHVTVGEGAVLGMGAVLLQDVPAREVWAGVPARRLRATRVQAQAGTDAHDRTSLEETSA